MLICPTWACVRCHIHAWRNPRHWRRWGCKISRTSYCCRCVTTTSRFFMMDELSACPLLSQLRRRRLSWRCSEWSRPRGDSRVRSSVTVGSRVSVELWRADVPTARVQRPCPALGGLQIPCWLGSDPPMGWWLGLAPVTLEFWVRFPNERNQGKQAHPVLKYRVPHGSQCVMGSLVHTGLGSSSLVAHVLPYYLPPPTQTALY
jgi:hypothetical protein